MSDARRILSGLCLVLGVIGIDAFASIRVGPVLREDEAIEAAIRGSQIVMLARVISIDLVAQPVDSALSYRSAGGTPPLRIRRMILEPIEYIKGGLDGDRIEAYRLEGGLIDVGGTDRRPLWSLAGNDTLASFFFLQSDRRSWYMRLHLQGDIPQGAPQPQRTWAAQVVRLKALADSVEADSSRSAPSTRSAR